VDKLSLGCTGPYFNRTSGQVIFRLHWTRR